MPSLEDRASDAHATGSVGTYFLVYTSHNLNGLSGSTHVFREARCEGALQCAAPYSAVPRLPGTLSGGTRRNAC